MASAGITALLKKMDYKDVVIAIDGSLFRYLLNPYVLPCSLLFWQFFPSIFANSIHRMNKRTCLVLTKHNMNLPNKLSTNAFNGDSDRYFLFIQSKKSSGFFSRRFVLVCNGEQSFSLSSTSSAVRWFKSQIA